MGRKVTENQVSSAFVANQKNFPPGERKLSVARKKIFFRPAGTFLSVERKSEKRTCHASNRSSPPRDHSLNTVPAEVACPRGGEFPFAAQSPGMCVGIVIFLYKVKTSF